MQIKRRNGYLISAVLLLALTLITLFVIFLFMHPTVYFSKASGFSQHDGVRAGKNKLRFVVPETVDTTKSTYISVKQEWFETSRMGRITDIKAKPGKHLALDFTDREYNQEVFTIYTKNWFGIKREHDVIVDYSNFLRVFFPESQDGDAPRKPIILPYSKLQTEYKHIYEELYKMKGFAAFDEKGQASGQPVSKEEVFVKENARGRAFIVNNNTHISLVYDFLLPGIFKNQAQKTQVYDLVEKVMGKARTLDPESQGLEIKLNTPPFYISKFLGWYYNDPAGNRVDLKPGQEFLIPQWVKSELRLIAKYDITTDTDKIGPELDKQGLVAVSYFDGAERVFFDIVKKGSPLKEHVYQKPGYTYEGWYRDSSLTEKVNFAYEVADAHTVLYLKSVKQNQPQPEKPIQYHTVNFITPSDANQLFSTRRAHGQKLETNYLIPSLVSRLDDKGNLWELDYWTIVDHVSGNDTGKRFDFNTPITEDITLKAVMRKRIPPTSKYTIKRYYESVDQAGNFIEDKSKEEVVENQTPGQEVQLSPTQTNAPTGFKLVDGTVTNKKINKDGTTVFELKYTRNRYKVNFEVNYNGNHFKDVNASATPEQTVLHEGKVTKPTNPTITKAGYTYTFKHWQLKDEMGNVYKEVSEFDFNTKITKNLTLVAYFEEKKDTATYTVKHIFQGIQNQIDERIEEKKFTEQVGKQITVTQENRDKNFDEHFEVADFTETKKVESDGSTVFEIRYARKKYRVNFEVNYNGNHFTGANASSEPTQTIPYQGKVKKPEFLPSLDKPGHTYTFKHWQLKDEMGNVYREVSAFDFDNAQVTKNTTLVAYFQENVQTANYTIKHIYKGLDSSQDIVELQTKNAQVGSSVTVSQADAISKPGFEIKPQSETKTIQGNGQTTFTLTYERKTYLVEYNYNSGTLNGETQTAETYKFEEVLRDVDHPQKTDPAHLKTYTFVGWQDEATGQMVDFSKDIKVVKNLKLKAIWQEATATRPVYLKMIWEKINEPADQEVEQEISTQRTIGATAQITDADIQAALNQFITNNPRPNHENNFDAANSVPTVTITASTDKHYITVYFKAKTYKVTFDRSGLLNSSVDNALKQPITLKYSQVLSADLIAKMKAVKKVSTGNKDYVFTRLIETGSGQTFQEGIAYNKDITLKPEFTEKDVLVDVTPKVAAHDSYKADASSWEVQTGKVGDTFNYQPLTGVKKGWRLVGWSKTNNGIAEDIKYTRDLKEVYAVFAPAETTYTIKHIFKGIPEDNIADVEKTVTKNALTNSSVQLTNADKYHDYNENGYDLQLPPAAQTIKADGSTEFTITYVRREFNVTFKVNYNNQFPGTAGNIPSSQKVKFEGKVKQPTNPTITKNGRTYEFKHWQLESSMHGSYSEQQPYNFSSSVQGDISLVAYFKEIIHKVNYKIVHYLEKTGKDGNLNGQYERIEEIKSDQKVEDGAVYQDYSGLDKQLYEKHTTRPENKLTAQLTAGDNSVEVCQYYKLKEVEVKFKKTEGIASFTYETLKVKKTRSVVLPGYTLKDTHNFIGWALSKNGQIQNEFVVEKTTSSLEIYARTDFQDREITYTIKKEKPDGTFEDEITEKKTGKIGSKHTAAYANPDETTYQNPTFDKDSLTVNADNNQNKVLVTIKRKVYEVTFDVKGHSSTVAKRTIRHGATIGAIDESQFAAAGLGIKKAELDGKEKEKTEIENFIVQKNHKVTLHIGRPTKKFGKYPQTKVDNPTGIQKIKDETHELTFNSKNKNYTMQFTRSYWQDSEGNKYEKYNNQYFKIEPVDFVKIPKLDTLFTEKIIDFSPFNLYYSGYSDNAKPERSIFKAMVEDIGKVLEGEIHMPTYDSGDFRVLPALQANLQSQLKKESTDYAKAVLNQFSNHTSNYRGTNLSSFGESGVYWPYYSSGTHQYWWLGTQYPNSNPRARSINSNGNLNDYDVYIVLGVVVCIR